MQGTASGLADDVADVEESDQNVVVRSLCSG
jgi:hypothetical protein